MTNSFLVYLGATFLTLYGLRSLIAGIRNEAKSYWMKIGWDDSKKVLKGKYNKVNNIVWGFISLVCGIWIFIGY